MKKRWAAVKTSCDTVVAGYEEIYPMADRDLAAQNKDFVRGPMSYQAGMKYAECGLWDKFVTDIASRGDASRNAQGTEVMIDAEKAGHGVEGALFTYLDQHASDPFGYVNGQFATAHVVTWMQRTNKLDAKYCPRILGYAKTSKADRVDWWLAYLGDARCTAAIPLVEPRLADPDPVRRVQACTVMGQLGTNKNLPKLQAVANNDIEFRWSDTVQVFYVRDACKSGMTAITVRGK